MVVGLNLNSTDHACRLNLVIRHEDQNKLHLLQIPLLILIALLIHLLQIDASKTLE